jgi:hypothetical protein
VVVLALFDRELTTLLTLGTLAPNRGAFPELMAVKSALFLAVAPAFTTNSPSLTMAKLLSLVPLPARR